MNTIVNIKQYEEQVHTLEQCVLHYEAAFNEPPTGYVSNNSQVPHFHIPVRDTLYHPTKWIKLNDDRTISGYADMQGPNKQPYIIDLYTQANNSTNSPIKTLPTWSHHMLTGPRGNFQILQTTITSTKDWGLAREITQYRDLDNDITALAIKLKAYQHNINATRADLMSCKSCLMLAHAAKQVKTLQNIAHKPEAVQSGWKRTHRGMCSTYVHGHPF
jgi:hypothetical protein